LIVQPWDLKDAVDELYRLGLPPGFSTGWKTVDPHYTIQPGQFTVITGIPGHGKSEWLDALCIHLAKTGKWHFFVFSPENLPVELHIAKLVQKWEGKMFGAHPFRRMSADEMHLALSLVNRHFGFIRPLEGREQVQSLDWVVDQAVAEIAIHRRIGENYNYGIVLDPWNEVEHQRGIQFSETEYISHALSYLRRAAREVPFHAWIVAHPRILQKDKSGVRPVPTLYDISGSAHWYNKCDAGITVWRDTAVSPEIVQIHVQKVRFRHLGVPGMVELKWDPLTGRYYDLSKAESENGTGHPDNSF